jgi:hypothetical protein
MSTFHEHPMLIPPTISDLTVKAQFILGGCFQKREDFQGHQTRVISAQTASVKWRENNSLAKTQKLSQRRQRKRSNVGARKSDTIWIKTDYSTHSQLVLFLLSTVFSAEVQEEYRLKMCSSSSLMCFITASAVIFIAVRADVFVANSDVNGDNDVEVDLSDSNSRIFGVRPKIPQRGGPGFINLGNGGYVHIAPGSSGIVGLNIGSGGPLWKYRYLNHRRPLRRSWRLRYGGNTDMTNVHIPAGRLPRGYAGTVYTYSSATNDAKVYLIPQIPV